MDTNAGTEPTSNTADESTLPSDPPLVLDVDGTLTRPVGRGLDPRLFDPIATWNGPVVIATGKAFPFPVGICQCFGIQEIVVAENGGVIYDGESVEITGNDEGPKAVAEAYLEAGYSLGWGPADTVNRWRETEVVVSLDQPEEPLREIAAEHGVEVVDTGYAYHVKDPGPSKGDGVRRIATSREFDLERTVAIGDSENDVSTFEIVGRSYALANADEAARTAAEHVIDQPHADGTLSVLETVRGYP